MKLNTAVGVLCMFMGWFTYAQNGTIKGTITEEKTDTTLVRASVFLDGTSLGTRTNLQGYYEINNVPPGDYKMVVNYPRKQYKKTVEVTVSPGETVEMNVAIGEEVKRLTSGGSRTSLSAFVVKGSEAQATVAKKEEEAIVSITTSEEMSKKGQSKASDAVRAVSGVSLEDGKYANIRGLNDRYIKTTLNGAEIPGLDPNRNAVQLDLFPTSFLSGIKVYKTFTPDLPGDFAGGLIDISTKDAPDSLTIKMSVNGKYNPQVHMNGGFLTYEGGSTDWLGKDDGTRSLPSDVLEASQNGSLPALGDVVGGDQTSLNNRAYLTELSQQYNPIMDRKTNSQLGTNKGFLDHSIVFTMGNSMRKLDSLGKPTARSWGYFLGFNYRRSYSFFENGQVGRYTLTGDVDNSSSLNGERLFNKTQSKDNVLIGGLASLNYHHSATSKFKLSYVHNHSGTNRTAYSSGFDDNEPNSEFRVVELDFIQRSIDNVQLSGEQKFHTGKNRFTAKESSQSKMKTGEHVMDWIVSYTQATQDQPDYRIYSDEKFVSNGNVNYEINPATTRKPTRFYRHMKEANYDAKINYQLTHHKTDTSHLIYKFGLSSNMKQRRFEEYWMEYDGYLTGIQSMPNNGNPDDFIAKENIGTLADGATPGLLVFENSKLSNRYDGLRFVPAGYAMADFNIGKKTDVVAGLRGEYTLIQLESDDPKKPTSDIGEFSYLPSLSFNYHLIDGKDVKDKRDTTKLNRRDMQLRGAYNKTLARPSFREIAPFFVEDFVRKLILVGNPGLELTDVHNFDLSWELYPRSNEMLTVSGFYKYFVNPIGLFNDVNALNPTFTWNNLEYAQVYGVEIEFKKKLDVISKSLKNFSFGANLSLVRSITPIPQAELDQIRQTDPYRKSTRPMTGQSPYLINASIEYKGGKKLERGFAKGLSTNLTFNIFGDRIAVYSNDGAPDIYEKARPELNWNLRKELSNKLSMTIRVRNILNPSYRLAYEYKGNSVYDKFSNQEANFSSYKKGVSFGLGFSYKFK